MKVQQNVESIWEDIYREIEWERKVEWAQTAMQRINYYYYEQSARKTAQTRQQKSSVLRVADSSVRSSLVLENKCNRIKCRDKTCSRAVNPWFRSEFVFFSPSRFVRFFRSHLRPLRSRSLYFKLYLYIFFCLFTRIRNRHERNEMRPSELLVNRPVRWNLNIYCLRHNYLTAISHPHAAVAAVAVEKVRISREPTNSHTFDALTDSCYGDSFYVLFSSLFLLLVIFVFLLLLLFWTNEQTAA